MAVIYKSYVHEPQKSLKVIFQLLATIGSGKYLSTFNSGFNSKRQGTYAIATELKFFQHSEASTLLLLLAAMCRNGIEAAVDETIIQIVAYPVGKIRERLPGSRLRYSHAENLSFRHACNKIIHARTISFKTAPKRNSHHSSYLLPQVGLYGKERKIFWHATIDINEFAKVAWLLIDSNFLQL